VDKFGRGGVGGIHQPRAARRRPVREGLGGRL